MNLISLKQEWANIKREKAACCEAWLYWKNRGDSLWLGFLLILLCCSEVASDHMTEITVAVENF